MRILNQADTNTQKKTSTPRRRFLLRDESGQSLIIVALALFAIVGVAALAIDAASWYQRHHQAQVAADAAALAAANCLAYSGSGQTCTSTTDTADAVSVATNYAKSNGVTIPASDVNFDNPTYPSVITVTTPNKSPALFAGIFGIGTTTQTAKSAATWKDTGSNCTNSGAGCQLIFANDNSCTGTGVSITTDGTGNSVAIEGGVQSNGSITVAKSSGNPTYDSTPEYATNCTGPSTTSVTKPWTKDGVTATVPRNWPNDWPVDYRDLYPACTASPGTYSPLFGYVTCNASKGNVPSYCDQAGTSFPSLSSSSTPNQIYCAYGTGNPQDPSTWNGNITETGALIATLIGGSVSASNSGGGASGPKPGNNLWIYAAQSGGSLTVNMSGNATASGSMFAPFGTANVTMAGTTGGSGIFIEGLDVVFASNGTPAASGPQDNSNGTLPASIVDGLLS